MLRRTHALLGALTMFHPSQILTLIICNPWPEAVAYSSGCDPAFAMAQPSKEHGHELRVVKKFPVTRLQRLPSRVQSLDE